MNWEVMHNLCEICKRTPCLPACPNFIPQKTRFRCSACKEGIYEGEEYIENDFGEHRHYDCFHGMKDLLEWLGYKIQTMENTT